MYFCYYYVGDCMDKYMCFLRNTKELSDSFGFLSLLYGSLGLEVLTGESLSSDDIDILIPNYYVNGDGWELFRSTLEYLGYDLIDLHEHTFQKNGICYSYASIENLKGFAGIGIEEISKVSDQGVEYLLLNLEQYLRVYEKSSQDGYRVNKKNKQDNKKIEFIKEKLNCNN